MTLLLSSPDLEASPGYLYLYNFMHQSGFKKIKETKEISNPKDETKMNRV